MVSGVSSVLEKSEEGGYEYDDCVGVLSDVGLKLKREWLDDCVAELERSVTNFRGFTLTEKATLCLEKFLLSDMYSSGGGVLPDDVASKYSDELTGPFVLQVDEIVKTGPLNKRYAFMTDGVRRAVGVEYIPIQDLQVLPPSAPTLKILVSDVRVRFGMILLTPEIEVLKAGEEARELVHEAVQNPRAKGTTEDQEIDDYYPCPDDMADAHVSVNMAKLLSAEMRDLTYFAELSHKWAREKKHHSVLHGIIKCSVIELKEFGFHAQSKSNPELTYYIVCSANDGVFNYDILLHNDVVQKSIGHSAQELMNGMFSSESTDIKDTFKEKKRRCKLFLAGFRGMMLVEMNKSSKYPVAIELLGDSIYYLK